MFKQFHDSHKNVRKTGTKKWLISVPRKKLGLNNYRSLSRPFCP